MPQLLLGVIFLLFFVPVTIAQTPDSPLTLCTIELTDFRTTQTDILIDRQSAIIRSRFSKLTPLHTLPDLLQFNCFVDANFTAQKLRTEQHLNGTQSTVYQLVDQQFGYAIISITDGNLLAKIQDEQGRIFTITPESNTAYAIAEWDNVARDEGVICQQFTQNETSINDSVTEGHFSICEPTTLVCSAVTVDVMVIYTPEVRASYGTNATTANVIATAITEANQALQNSEITSRFSLTHTQEVTYTENGSLVQTMYDLQNRTNGVLDEIHDLRNAHEADLVAMIVEEGDGCGIGNVNINPNAFDDNRAFSVTISSCMVTNFSLAHEMGHNVGLQHDWHVSQSTAPCTFAHGYVNSASENSTPEQQWRTIMAYQDQCLERGYTCQRIPYFSNPDLNYNNDPLGVRRGEDNPSDAAFILNRSMCQVAEFKENSASQPNLKTKNNSVMLTVNNQFIDLETTIENSGFVPSETTNLVFYLSHDPIISTDDYPIGNTIIPVLAVNETSEQQFTFDAQHLDLLNGTYYVGYIIDNQELVEENTEVDNAHAIEEPQLVIERSLSALPLTLLYFSVEQQSTMAMLRWQTASQINIKHFVIERSLDGYLWENIVQLEADNNGNYRWQDNTINQLVTTTQTIYYRLKIVELDNQHAYSNTHKLLIVNDLYKIKVFPNPTSHLLNIQFPTATTATAYLRNCYGKLVYQLPKTTANSTREQHLNVTGFPAGIYLLTVKSTTGQQWTERIVIK